MHRHAQKNEDCILHLGRAKTHAFAGLQEAAEEKGQGGIALRGDCFTIPSNEGEIAVELKIVFVRNRNKKKEWLAIASTGAHLESGEIVRLYGRRRGIEVFLKWQRAALAWQKSFHAGLLILWRLAQR